MKACKHKNCRCLKVDGGGIFCTLVKWCRDCGALRSLGGWSKPKRSARVDAMRLALDEFATCNLTDENCANLDVANRRIRNIARRALED